MDLSSLNDLDFNESGEWPIPVKVAAILVLCILVWAGSYWFIIKEMQGSLVALEQKENELKKAFEQKQAKANKLEKYEKQTEELNKVLSSMLHKLPQKNKMNMDDLLSNVSRIGLEYGVELHQFKPENARPVEIYTELPINMVITGTYHQLGKFTSDIAKLPRIVTLHDFSMTPLTAEDNSGKITMNVMAKTYYQIFDEAN